VAGACSIFGRQLHFFAGHQHKTGAEHHCDDWQKDSPIPHQGAVGRG